MPAAKSGSEQQAGVVFGKNEGVWYVDYSSVVDGSDWKIDYAAGGYGAPNLIVPLV